MIEMETIIEGVNKYIENIRHKQNINALGFLYLKRNEESHPTFKAYRKIIVNVYYVTPLSKYKVLTVSCTGMKKDNVSSDIVKDLVYRLTELLVNEHNSIIDGTYKGQ